ncbi:unnamed protein product [Soboliphyme baturini]|uniref:RGS domain-containing protein n=1 Tax=Soboliphyme baturini TaxID=241478 RepID=A0A183IHY0_9BILA|nr:unnamed protein product [Soboliphyme baturini]
MQASSILSFENELRIKVEDCICKETGPLKVCFEVAFCSVIQCLSEEFLPRFLNSKFYSKLLQDLYSAANNDQDLALSLACTASEDLTGLEDLPKFSAKLSSTESLVQSSRFCDSGSLCSVDSLTSKSTLKFGIAHLDPMGRYIRDISELPKSSGSQRSAFFSEKLRKFIQPNQTEEQVWMAEQVAELIVEDIKRMTASANALSQNTQL